MFDDDKLPVSAKSTALVHNFSRRGRVNRLTLRTGDVDAFGAVTWREARDRFAIRGPAPHDWTSAVAFILRFRWPAGHAAWRWRWRRHLCDCRIRRRRQAQSLSW